MNFPRKHGGGVIHKEEAKKSLLFHDTGMIALALGGVKKRMGATDAQVAMGGKGKRPLFRLLL